MGRHRPTDSTQNITMTSRTRPTRTVLSALALAGALFVGSQPATANASDPDPVLTDGLRAFAAEFGDAFGHIVSTNSAGAPVVLALDSNGYGVYTGGDDVAIDDTLAFCSEDPAGGLSSCEEVLPPGSTEYECGWNGEWSWCTCNGLIDCLDMFKNGPCTEGGDTVCDEDGCICEA